MASTNKVVCLLACVHEKWTRVTLKPNKTEVFQCRFAFLLPSSPHSMRVFQVFCSLPADRVDWRLSL